MEILPLMSNFFNIVLITRLNNVGESVRLINISKMQTASAHGSECGSGDGGCINPLKNTIVAQQLENKAIISVLYFLRCIQILGYLRILAHHSTINEQYTDMGLLNLLCHACNSGKLWYACRQQIQYIE